MLITGERAVAEQQWYSSPMSLCRHKKVSVSVALKKKEEKKNKGLKSLALASSNV